MIKIDGVEILTVLEGFTWSGAKDICTRNLSFSFLYNPLKKDIPKYNVSVGSKVEWIENGRTLFLGYVEQMPYNTDDDTMDLSCQDLMSRLARSTFIGRMRGTFTEITNKICGTFGLKNGIQSNNKHIHNIVSDGDMTYFDVLRTACDSVFPKSTLYLDTNILKITDDTVINNFEIGYNIRSSYFTQSMADMVNKVLIISNEGKVLKSVENTEDIKKFGLFQATYNYNKECKNNIAEAQKLLKSVSNEGEITVDNDNNCISGRYIKIYEPVNKLNGIFEIVTDNHTINTNGSYMTLGVNYVTNG